MRAHYSQRPQTNRLVEPALWINSVGQSCDWGHGAGRGRQKARGGGVASTGGAVVVSGADVGCASPPVVASPGGPAAGARGVANGGSNWGEYVEASTAENLRVPR